MAKLKDITGQRFGRLVAQSYERIGCGKYRWKCLCDCGKIHFINNAGQLRSGMISSCGCLKRDLLKQRTGIKSPVWKGRRSINKHGYAVVYISPREYRLEHVYLMEQKLGRRLQPGETVHHKNGVRDDNRENNLELWSSSQPAGQRVADKVRWALEILQLYAPEKLS